MGSFFLPKKEKNIQTKLKRVVSLQRCALFIFTTDHCSAAVVVVFACSAYNIFQQVTLASKEWGKRGIHLPTQWPSQVQVVGETDEVVARFGAR